MDDAVTLQNQLTKIKAARASGALVVRHGDSSTTFRSLKEMDAIIKDLENKLASANGTKRQRVKYLTQTGKAL